MKINVWLLAARPKTLSASIAPVLIGTAMAYQDGLMHLPSAFSALLAALLIQIGTNFANDYFDYIKGADTSDRMGPLRVTQAELVKPETMKWAFILAFGLSIPLGFYLVFRGGVPVLVIGLSAFVFGVLYTGGPKPLGYLGLGEPLVLGYFGPVALAGTYYVQAKTFDSSLVVAGLAPGFLSTALLSVNNLRDRQTDAKAGKKTLAVRFGKQFARAEYVFCILASVIIPPLIFLIYHHNWTVMLASLFCLSALSSIWMVLKSDDPKDFIKVLDFTGKLLLIYSIAFSAGCLL